MTPEQLTAGLKWAATHRRYPARTATQAIEDREAEEARDEARDTFRGGNR